MEDSNDSVLSDDWSPAVEFKRRPRTVRRIISDDDDTDSSEAEIVPGTSDEESNGDDEEQTSDAETAIVEGSFEEVAGSGSNLEVAAANVSLGHEPLFPEEHDDAAALETSGNPPKASPIQTKEIKESTPERKKASPVPQIFNSTHVTSTPLVSGLKKPTPLDITFIPSTISNFNATIAEEADESWEDWTKMLTSAKPSTVTSAITKLPVQQNAELLQPQGSKPKTNRGVPTVDEVEDMLVKGLNDITLKGAKEFTFKKKTGDDIAKSKPGGVGATCLDFFDEEEEDDQSISANFDFNSGSGASETQLVRPEQPPLRGMGREVVTLDDSDDDDIKVLTERVKKLPLGHTASNKEPPKRTIFLNEPPPIEKKTYAYDPSSARHEDFYGDVQRTVTKMAKTMEEMPMPDDDEELALPKGLVELFDHQRYGLRWLSWREREFPGGGILADEMGLGKTIMVIALIMKSKMEAQQQTNQENWIDTEDVGNLISCKTTLVVCPVGCMDQWKEEIQGKGKGLRVHSFHGQDRKASAALLAQYDVVLTTYRTILSEIPKDSRDTDLKSPLKRLYWRRIVLDEAHNIRNPKTGSALAICQLKSRNRWAVTGTPVHNRPEDFYSFVKFLRMKPFDDPKVWDFWIGMKQVRKATDAQHRLHILAKSLVLRRTKTEVESAGGNVRKIPPKTVNIVEVELGESETKVYEYLVQFCQSMMQKFMQEKEQRDNQLNAVAMTYTAERHKKKPQSGNGGVPSDIKFSHLFALLVRLRQCAVLPHLIQTMLEDEEIDEDVSFDELDDNHIISKINPVFDRMYASSKIQKILEDVEALRQQAKEECRPMDKVVVVSSWTTTLDILHDHFRRMRISCVSITGKDTTSDRTDSLKKFNNYPEKYHVCLLSLMAGGVGLNLVGGNHVFFVEPHWNPQLELQAQDRVHRFGQTKNVTVNRYISKETVETRILGIQEGKMDLADGVLNSAKATRGGGLSIPQLLSLFK